MSALKQRMAAQKKDRVEEMVAATRPRTRRTRDRLVEELETAGEDVTEVESVALTVVPGEVSDEAEMPSEELVEVAEAVEVLAGDASGPAAGVAAPAPKKAAPRTPKPTVKTDTPVVGEEPWRRFLTPPAARGTATLTRRLNIPTSSQTLENLAALDYQVKTEGSRWVVNRSDLLTAACEVFLADPDGWNDRYLAARLTLPETPATLQGRVPPNLADALDMARFTPTGKRVVGPVLSFIVDELLAGRAA